MTTRLESTTSIKEWSTPAHKVVEGQPPGPGDHPSTLQGEARKADVRTITPQYKVGAEKSTSEFALGTTGHIPRATGDYTVKSQQQHYLQRIIDPKVASNANLPAGSSTLPGNYRKKLVDDFPSQHSKRSLIKLEPMEQRRFKSVESRPITTSAYLTESVDRHRDMEASRLREYLKAKEDEANQPWKKPNWPGPKATRDDNSESLRELEHIKQKLETLQKAANERPKDASSATWQFSQHSFSPRSVVSVNGATRDEGLLKVRTDYAAAASQDEKPRGIMKRRELETREQLLYADAPLKTYERSVSSVSAKPKVTETVQRFEETRRTEEIERRVQRREKRERRSSRSHQASRRHGGGGGYQEEWHYSSAPQGQLRSSSLSLHNGYVPSNESYHRSTSTHRERDFAGSRGWEERGLAHARYGSLSDSLRKGELKYVPNGELRENRNGFHKSHSTRDVFSEGGWSGDHRSQSSWRHGGGGGGPLVEFPPTLPRDGRPLSSRDYRPVAKSRSYADWDDHGRAGFPNALRRFDDHDMTRLENEFRDSLLMELPRGNVQEKDSRTEQLPGGYETFSKDVRAHSGRRDGRDGRPVDYNEASQEYTYKREQETDRRR